MANPTYCNSVPSNCCYLGLPQTLYATLTAANCPAANGTVIKLEFVSGQQWTGKFSPGGFCGELTFVFGITGPVCEYFMCIKNSEGMSVWGDCNGTLDMGTVTCPFSSATYDKLASANVPNCLYEIVHPPFCTGTIAASVAP